MRSACECMLILKPYILYTREVTSVPISCQRSYRIIAAAFHIAAVDGKANTHCKNPNHHRTIKSIKNHHTHWIRLAANGTSAPRRLSGMMTSQHRRCACCRRHHHHRSGRRPSSVYQCRRPAAVHVCSRNPIRCGTGQSCRSHSTVWPVRSRRHPSRRTFALPDRKQCRWGIGTGSLGPMRGTCV